MIDSCVPLLHKLVNVSASCDPCFFFTASQTFGQLQRIFGQMVHRPLAKNCSYAHDHIGIILVLSKANVCRLEVIALFAQLLNLKVSH